MLPSVSKIKNEFRNSISLISYYSHTPPLSYGTHMTTGEDCGVLKTTVLNFFYFSITECLGITRL